MKKKTGKKNEELFVLKGFTVHLHNKCDIVPNIFISCIPCGEQRYETRWYECKTIDVFILMRMVRPF